MRIPLLMFALACCSTSTLRAALVIDVKDATLDANGTGFVDVYLTGGNGDVLEQFGYEFNITGAIAASGDLQFAVAQSNSEQSVASTPPYVFLGDTHIDNFSSVRGSNGTDPVTLVGGDSLLDGDDVSVDGTFLLARLELQHVGPFTPGSYNFTISLNTVSSLTLFDKDRDSETDTANEFSATPGTVTVNASAVPEPSSFLLVAGALAGLGLRQRKRRIPCP